MTGAKKSALATWPCNFSTHFHELGRSRQGPGAERVGGCTLRRVFRGADFDTQEERVSRVLGVRVIYWEAFMCWSVDGSIKQFLHTKFWQTPANGPRVINCANFQFLFLGQVYGLWHLTQDSFGRAQKLRNFFWRILISRFCCYEFFISYGRSLFHSINYDKFFLIEVSAL